MNSKVLLILIVSLVLLFFGYLIYEYVVIPTDYIVYSGGITKEENYCIVDDDCGLVQLSCCPNPYGSVEISVNREGVSKINEWKEENCLNCTMNWTIDHFPFFYNESYCETNQCKKKSLPNCESITMKCSSVGKEETIKKFSQIELDELGMTAEKAVESCGC